MAHFFVPRDEGEATYGETTEVGPAGGSGAPPGSQPFLHAWKMTIDAGGSGKIGLFGGYDRGTPPWITSSIAPGSGARSIRVTGKRPEFTILEARNTDAVWCSLQVEARPQRQLYTPAIPLWRLDQFN